MNKELWGAMDVLEKEYNISKETLLEAIENSLITACKNHFGKADNAVAVHSGVAHKFPELTHDVIALDDGGILMVEDLRDLLDLGSGIPAHRRQG